ncbi:hypothetical protein PENTCL1PPCAC_23603, partial [Pristionchus entomophagus]
DLMCIGSSDFEVLSSFLSHEVVCQWYDFITDQNLVVNDGIEIAVIINVKGRSGDRFRKIPQK